MTKRKADPMSRVQICKLAGAATARSAKRYRFTADDRYAGGSTAGRIMEKRASDPLWAARFKAWGRAGGIKNRRKHA